MLNVERPFRVLWMCRCVVCLYLSWFLLSSGCGVLLVMVFLKLCSVSQSVPMFFVLVECGAKVGFVPLNVFDRATKVWGVADGSLHFFCNAFKLEPALGVVFPDGGSQHRRLGVCVERPCFHRCMKVFEVVELLHLAPPEAQARAWPVLCFRSGRPPA